MEIATFVIALCSLLMSTVTALLVINLYEGK